MRFGKQVEQLVQLLDVFAESAPLMQVIDHALPRIRDARLLKGEALLRPQFAPLRSKEGGLLGLSLRLELSSVCLLTGGKAQAGITLLQYGKCNPLGC